MAPSVFQNTEMHAFQTLSPAVTRITENDSEHTKDIFKLKIVKIALAVYSRKFGKCRQAPHGRSLL